MAVRVCVAIREPSTDDAVSAAARAAEWADLVEIRADYIRDLDVRRIVRAKPCPLIFTVRSSAEGGQYKGSERTRIETILDAAHCGADYVDVEFSAFWKVVLENAGKEKVIVSHHDFQGTPADLDDLVNRMAATGAGTIKIATMARCLADNLKIRNALKHATAGGIQACMLAMGLPGVASRVLGGTWGSWMTFASLPGGQPTADGQMTAEELVNSYRIRDIGPQTELYAVVGKPLGHSLSPAIHNSAFAARGRNAVFLALEACSAEDVVLFDSCVPIRGASVTIPYKEELGHRTASMSIEADQVGAVNTLVRKNGGWHGENTDVEGFIRPLRRRMHVGKVRAAVLGAGGAARAVVYALRSSGASVTVVARDPAKGQALAGRFQAGYLAWTDLPQLRWDLLVNTTPVGMHPDTDSSPVAPELLKGGWVYDLVYNPAQTRLLKEAAARGCKVISGAEMFLAQAIKQQMLWLGPPVPEHVMKTSLARALGCAIE